MRVATVSLNPAIDQIGRRRDGIVFQPISAQRCLRCLGAPGHRGCSRNTNADVGTDTSVVDNDYNSDADDGVSRGLVGEFLVAPTVPFCRHRYADLSEDFVRL